MYKQAGALGLIGKAIGKSIGTLGKGLRAAGGEGLTASILERAGGAGVLKSLGSGVSQAAKTFKATPGAISAAKGLGALAGGGLAAGGLGYAMGRPSKKELSLGASINRTLSPLTNILSR